MYALSPRLLTIARNNAWTGGERNTAIQACGAALRPDLCAWRAYVGFS